MNYYPIHDYYIINGNTKPVERYQNQSDEDGIYEVLRIEKGVPLFMEEHLDRFYKSASLAKKSIRFNNNEITGFIKVLISKNKVLTGNILILCKDNLKLFYINHKYPESEWYEIGVICEILKAERKNPNVKIYQSSVRQQANALIKEKGLYEVLLTDQSDRITEGSRSNLFFIKNDELITPPSAKVLMGITRQKTILLAKKAGIPFSEQDVYVKNLAGFQALFITGTSPKILPVSQIGNMSFNPQHPLVKLLQNSYNKLVSDYIATNSGKYE